MWRYVFPLLLLAAVLTAVGCGREERAASGTDGGAEPLVLPNKGEVRDTRPVAEGESPPEMRAQQTTAPQADGAQGGTADLPANLADRKISYEANVVLSVEDPAAQRGEVERLARSAGGYVAASRAYLQGEDRVVELTLRIPADRYDATMESLRGLAVEVKDEQASSRDMTEEYTDLEARLRNLEAVEQQYQMLLGRATQIGEVLQVQDRLNITRMEIDRVRGRIELLDRMTELATIHVQLLPAAAGADGGQASGWDPAGAAERAWEASLRLLGTGAEAAIMAAVFSWWLLPLLVPAWWLARRWRLRGQPRPQSGTAGT